MRLLAALLIGLFLTCGIAPAMQLRVETLTIETVKGSFSFAAEIAETPEQRSLGLMHRASLASDRAMLFDFGAPREVALWMKNTDIPLDMIFVRPDGTIARIAEHTVPQSLDVISSGEEVIAAIEVVAGTARRIGLARGDRVRHRLFGSRG